MIELLQAITTAFNADGSLVKPLFTGGLSFEVAEDTGGTVIMQVITAPQTNTYGGEAFSEPMLQFTIWGEGATDSLVKARKFCNWLRTLTLPAGVFALTRQHDPLPAPDSPQPTETGSRLYGWIVTYTASVSTTQEALS